MLTRPLGPDGARVSILGLGCGRIGSFNNPASEAESLRLLERALDLGVTLFDTADVYGQGDSEQALGRLLRGRRDAAFVVSKVGLRFSAMMRLLRPLKSLIRPIVSRSSGARDRVTARRAHTIRTDFSPAYLRSAVDASLRRLKCETIDALLLHGPGAADLDDPALAETLQAIRRAGKVRAYGVSCDDCETVAAALRMPGLSVIQVNPFVLHEAGSSCVEAMRSGGIGILLREAVRARPDFCASDAVAAAARDPAISSVIAGTTSPRHLEQLVRGIEAGAIACSAETRSVASPLVDPG